LLPQAAVGSATKNALTWLWISHFTLIASSEWQHE
jgi:hypothetical protein